MVKFLDLYEVCKSGDENKVHELLQARVIKQKTSIRQLFRVASSSPTASQDLCNHRAPDTGYSCLHIAALHGHAGVVSELLAYNPQLAFTTDRRGCVPLHLAAWHGSANTAEHLIKSDTDKMTVNARSSCFDTPLHHAVQQGHAKIVRLLLQADADPTKRNARGECALDIAARLGRTVICRRLVEHCPALVLQSSTDAANAVATHSMPFSDTPPPSTESTPAKKTFRDRFSRDNRGGGFRSYSLDCADVSADCPKQRATPGQSSIRRAPMAVAYPLHLAARNGHLDTCQLLIDVGFDVDFVTEQGSALHMAAVYARLPVLQMLLNAGASLSVCDWQSRTVMDVLREHTKDQAADLTQVMQNRDAWKECIRIIEEFEKSERAIQRHSNSNSPHHLNMASYANSPIHANVPQKPKRNLHDLETEPSDGEQDSSTSSRPDNLSRGVWQPLPDEAVHKIKQMQPSRNKHTNGADIHLAMQAMMIDTSASHNVVGDAQSIGPPSTITVSSDWAHAPRQSVHTPVSSCGAVDSAAGACTYQVAPVCEDQSSSQHLVSSPDTKPTGHLSYDNVPSNLLTYDNAPTNDKHWQHQCTCPQTPKSSSGWWVSDTDTEGEELDAKWSHHQDEAGTPQTAGAPLATPEEMLVSVDDTLMGSSMSSSRCLSKSQQEAQLIQQLSESVIEENNNDQVDTCSSVPTVNYVSRATMPRRELQCKSQVVQTSSGAHTYHDSLQRHSASELGHADLEMMRAKSFNQPTVAKFMRHKRNSALTLQLLPQDEKPSSSTTSTPISNDVQTPSTTTAMSTASTSTPTTTNGASATATPTSPDVAAQPVSTFQPRLSNVPPPPSTTDSANTKMLCDWLKSIHVHDNKVQAVAQALIKRGYDRLDFMSESIDIDWLERAIDADSCAAILLTMYDDDLSSTRRLPAASHYTHLSDWLRSLCCDEYMNVLTKHGIDSIVRLRQTLQSTPDPRLALHKLVPMAKPGHVHRMLVSLDKADSSPTGTTRSSIRRMPVETTEDELRAVALASMERSFSAPPVSEDMPPPTRSPEVSNGNGMVPSHNGASSSRVPPPKTQPYENDQVQHEMPSKDATNQQQQPTCSSPAPSYVDTNDQIAWLHDPKDMASGRMYGYDALYFGASQLHLPDPRSPVAADKHLFDQTRNIMAAFKQSIALHSQLDNAIEISISRHLVLLDKRSNKQTGKPEDVIAELPIDSILLAVQDERDQNYFAFVAQEGVDCLQDKATTIILTLGQAFDLTYRLNHSESPPNQ